MYGDNRDGIWGTEAHDAFAIDSAFLVKRYKTINCGYHHNAAIDENGYVYTWGRSTFGQLGQGEVINNALPTLLSAPLQEVKIAAVSCGWQHTMALTNQGFLFSWGLNINGQLGIGDYNDRNVPTVIESLIADPVSKISAGHSHSAIVTSDGKLYAWGANPDARLCRKTTYYKLSHRPKNINKPAFCKALKDRKMIDVSLGADHSLFLEDNGTVYASGNASRGQLGDNYYHPDIYPDPYVQHFMFSTGDTRAIKVQAGDGFSAILTSEGEVYTFGLGNYGRLGHHHGVSLTKPSRIDMLSVSLSKLIRFI